MTSQNGDFHFLAKSAKLVTSPGATGESYPLPVSGRARTIALELSAIFGWKLLLPVWWAKREKSLELYFGRFFWKFGVPYWMSTAASWAKLAEEGGYAPLLTTKYEPLPVGSDWFISAWTWHFSVFLILGVLGKPYFLKNGMCEFFLILYIVRVVVGLHNFIFSICPIQAHFFATSLKNIFIWRFKEIWHAIPDVSGRRLSEAGRGRGCTPLLTTKYEPDMVKTDRDIEVGNSMDLRFLVSETPRR